MPAAITGPVTSVGPATATATGTVNPNGLATTWYVEYGTSTSYGSKTATVSAGSYFGELGPTLNLPRSASARATMATTLTSYTTRHFRRRFPDDAASTDA